MAYIDEGTFDISFVPLPGHFEADDLLAFAIQALNRRGYKTHFCCEGHWHTPPEFRRLHIVVDDCVDLPSLPDGFSFSGCALEWRYAHTETPFALGAEKLAVCERLQDWADALPENPLRPAGPAKSALVRGGGPRAWPSAGPPKGGMDGDREIPVAEIGG